MLKKIFGSSNDRVLRKMRKTVKAISKLEESYEKLTDDDIQAKTIEFKKRYQEGETLDSLLVEAFALVREAGKRVHGMRHYDVQMIGGITLHQGKIAEMKTGEGKTLMATLPVYLNALSGKGVHLVTVNDYLAERDANWMRPLYEFLGMTVGIIYSGQMPDEKREAYAADITYGTNNEFGFDYLRDNMAFRLEDRAMRGLNFAIVDEVDSILIDEARTPLIISGQAEDSSELYKTVNKLIPKLQPMTEGDEPTGHFELNEEQRSVELTEEGHEFVEQLLIENGLLENDDSLYSTKNLSLLHHVQSGLRAHKLFHKDVEYMVQGGQIVLIDEHTGRTMPGRRLSEGLHQAIEAKENVMIHPESHTLASTTFQNFFRLYSTLSGMTNTADTEAFEFSHIYGLEVVVIPTNLPIARLDHNDLIFLSVPEKYDAIVKEVKEIVKKGAPVLVGTASVETSEALSAKFDQDGIKHNVLNAKFHESEAEIVAQAGQPGAITIATNMAGRGTDIVLGGNVDAEIKAKGDISEAEIAELKAAWKIRNQQVKDSGGLHIIGTERHESRRIDNQLRGRSGRQGDPGVSRFYLSMDDNLMRIFASPKIKQFMQKLGMENGEAIEHRMVTNSIEKAQRKVEGRNFDIRKNLLEFDDVANEQRQIIYNQRDDLLNSENISETITAIRGDVVNALVTQFVPPESIEEQWDIPGLEAAILKEFAILLPVQQWLNEDDRMHEESMREKILEEIQNAYNAKCEQIGPEIHVAEKQIMLQVLDDLWKEHLASMDHLRQSIGLRSYAQKNPKQEYKREAFEMFQQLLEDLKFEVIKILSHARIQTPEEIEAIERERLAAEQAMKMNFNHPDAEGLAGESQSGELTEGTADAEQPFVRDGRKVGRNEPCPCGSGKKYKQCHGKLA